MLKPQSSRDFRVMSIDPGTDTLGVSVLDLNLETLQTTLAEVHTFRGSQLQRGYPTIGDRHGDRIARLYGHEENLAGYMNLTRPDSIITEGPYLGRFPQAYAALVECVSAIRRAVIRYDYFAPLHVIDPSSVKKHMGVKGTSGDKGAMTRALCDLMYVENPKILNPSLIDIHQLDEHAIDSTCVGWYHVCKTVQALTS